MEKPQTKEQSSEPEAEKQESKTSIEERSGGSKESVETKGEPEASEQGVAEGDEMKEDGEDEEVEESEEEEGDEKEEGGEHEKAEEGERKSGENVALSGLEAIHQLYKQRRSRPESATDTVTDADVKPARGEVDDKKRRGVRGSSCRKRPRSPDSENAEDKTPRKKKGRSLGECNCGSKCRCKKCVCGKGLNVTSRKKKA